jgi:hypothetical protein|tara:strand:- start:22 stop:255 length:234 start_codon:yes stop_codon:yes gene_type:complete
MNEAEQEQGQGQDLSIQDLTIMKGIIDVASERGSFKPGEMAAVGTVYNKLEAFLKNIEEQQKAQVAADSVEETKSDA